MQTKKYNHKEAFCHMQYFGSNNTGSIRLNIWNSRDGVTPFITFSKEYGIELQHVNFHGDVMEENYKPKKGDLIWVSYNEETAKGAAEQSYRMHCDFLEELKAMTEEEIERKFHYDARSHLSEFLSDKDAYIKSAIHTMLEEHGEPQPKLQLVEEDWK